MNRQKMGKIQHNSREREKAREQRYVKCTQKNQKNMSTTWNKVLTYQCIQMYTDKIHAELTAHASGACWSEKDGQPRAK